MTSPYVITAQAPDQELNDAGTGFVNGWRVSYKVSDGPAKGTVGWVWVTNADHTAEIVSNMIEAKVNDLDAIAKLGGK